MSTDRRRSPRIEILGRLHGHSVTLDAPVVVRDFSLGGMAMETPFPFPVGATHDFRLTLGDGALVELRGRVLHCTNVARQGDSTLYLSGVHFIDDDEAEETSSVGNVIEAMQKD